MKTNHPVGNFILSLSLAAAFCVIGISGAKAAMLVFLRRKIRRKMA